MNSTPVAFKSADRLQNSFLAPLEKKALVWLARHMPAWVNSDHLTILGLLGMAGAGLSYYLARRHPFALAAVVVCIAINWFGDSLDGTLARVRGRQRPRYGFYVDHVVDTFGALMLVGGLGLSGYMTFGLAVALLIVYFILSIEIYLATHAIGVFRLSFGYWGPTELRLLLIVGNIVLFVRPVVTIAGKAVLLFDAGGVVAIAGMGVIVLTSVIRNAHRLYVEERID